MITISILGLDQYVVGHYSSENGPQLAKLFETDPDNIMFYAPNSYLFHNGVEQTSWNTLVRVNAPIKYKPLQEVIAKYIISTLDGITIHVAVEFYYFKNEDSYEKINREYPRFITDDNLVYEDEDEKEDAAEEEKSEEQIYDGNIFAEFNKKVAEQEGRPTEKTPVHIHVGDDQKHGKK